MKNIKTISIFIFSIFIIIAIIATLLLLSATTVSGTSIVGAIPQHKGTVCYYCHETRGFPYGGEDATCDNCHFIKNNIPLLAQVHSNVCSACHNIPDNDEQYHNLHKAVDCSKCHIKTGILPVKPTTGITNCAACHGITFSGGSNIHLTHKTILTSICTKCHGARPVTNPSGIEPVTLGLSEDKNIYASVSRSIGNTNKMIYAKVIDYKRYTLYEIFKVMFSVFH
jgi:hypothetical protein